MKKILFTSKYLNISFGGLLFSLLIIVVIFVIIRLLAKQFKNISTENEKFWLKLSLFRILTSIIIVFGLSGVAALNIKHFSKIFILNTKYFQISAFDISIILLIPLLTFFVINLLDAALYGNTHFKDKKKSVGLNTMLLLQFVFWSIAFGFLLKVVLVDASVITDFSLVRIKKINITIFDLFFFVFVFSFTALILLGLRRILKQKEEKNIIDKGNGTAVYQIVKYILWVIAVIVVLQASGVNISVILAGSAALLVGLGMGIQNLFNDVVSGIILLVERPLKVNDIVQVDEIVGEVLHIGIRTTTVFSRDGISLEVPNSKFTSEKIINWTKVKNITRFNIEIGVAYGSDVQLVIDSLLSCVKNQKGVSSINEPFVRFNNFGDSALEFQLYFWSYQNIGIEDIKSDLRISIDKIFRKNNISIPFPQRDIHMIKS